MSNCVLSNVIDTVLVKETVSDCNGTDTVPACHAACCTDNNTITWRIIRYLDMSCNFQVRCGPCECDKIGL